MKLDHLPGRSLTSEGKEWLYFSGTAYLGLALHPTFLSYLGEGIQRYGANFGGSRLSNLKLSIFAEAEAYLKEWLDMPGLLTVSSGSLAGQLLEKYLSRTSSCLYAPNIHPALLGSEQTFEGSFEEWIDFVKVACNKGSKPRYLLSSSVDALNAKLFPLDWFSELPDQVYWVIDDSHGLGVLGPEGKGIRSYLPSEGKDRIIIMSSMGKALGVPGGLIAGPQHLMQDLWESPFFGGASPIIPAYLYAMLKSADLRRTQFEQLRSNINQFKAAMEGIDLFSQIEGHPVFYIKDNKMAQFLKSKDILISSFNYPSKDAPLVSRIVINAAHTSADLEKLITFIKHYYIQKYHNT